MPWLRVLAVLTVGLCGPLPAVHAVPVAGVLVPAAADLCLNHTDVVLASIRVQNTVNATAEVIEARRTCASDYTWNGQECLRSITATVHCDSGYTLQNGRCERVEDAYCPTGFRKSPTGTCKLRVEFSVDCPPEHDWDGENCVHRMPGCRPGYQLLNGQCTKLVPGMCKVGTTLELGKCVRTQTAAVECSEGFELVGDECRRRGQRLCDRDYRLVDGECVREQTAGPVYQCRDDMRLEGTRCVSRTLTCPPGYALNGTQCVNVTIQCPANATLDAAGRCVRHECAPVEPRCEPGLQMFEGVCYSVRPERPDRCNSSMVLVNATCVTKCRTVEPACQAPAYLEGGACVGGTLVDRRPPAVCQVGFVLNNGWCVYVHPQCVVYLPECGPFFELRDGQCVRRVAVGPVCGVGLVLRGQQCVSAEPPEYECLAGYVLVGGVCQPVQRPVGCPVGQHLNGTVCVPDRLTPSCAPGSRLEGQWCVPDVPVLPTPICPEGYLYRNGTCWQVGATPICPPGYRLHNGQCYCPDSQPPTTTNPPAVCPPERPILAANGTCTSLNTIRPFCPPGYSFSPADGLCHRVLCSTGEHLLPGGTCQRIIDCPTGSVYNATLVRCVQLPCAGGLLPLPNGGGCPPVRPAPVDCPPGYRANANGLCALVLPPVCPPGYYYTHGACYPSAPPPTVPTVPAVPQNCTKSCGGDGGGGHENVVHTVTIVDRPVNVVTNNENNVSVHVYENGRLVRVQHNNGTVDIAAPQPESTTVEYEDDDEGDDDEGVTSRQPPRAQCCVVVSPRKCVQLDTDWDCTHRETRRCGSFCTSPKIYLIPRRNAYRDNVLVMRPPPRVWGSQQRWGGSGGSCDCSGCVGGGYGCSPSCYQYETCEYQDECRYVDQTSFCESSTGDGCTEADGYYA